MLSRRDLLWGGVVSAAFRNDTLDILEKLVVQVSKHADVAAQDEDFWSQVQSAFTLDRNTVNFNNGGCSPSPRVVQEAMQRQLDFSNQAPSNYMWRILEPEVESVRVGLARVFSCDPEELAITRNASESLANLIMGFDLRAGDQILTTNLDYPRVIMDIQQRERRDGVQMVQVKLPAVTKNLSDLIEPIQDAITPRTKLICIPQVSFLNGQIFPVCEIVELARKHLIPVVVDGAHAFVQYQFDNRDLNCDFYATSLHKWLMAPIGTGFMYVRKDRIKDVWSLMASNDSQKDNIRKFEEIGTHPAANHNAIAEALAFHDMMGLARKEARLRYLRKRWTDRLRELPKVKYATNLDPRHSCAITTVGIDGISPGDLGAWLLAKHSIFVTGIDSPVVKGIRVTPNVYSTVQEIDRFADAMIVAATKGIA
jgi:isopenicillin-N epimerase